MRQAAIDEDKAEGLTNDEREGLCRLRSENRILRGASRNLRGYRESRLILGISTTKMG